MARIPQYINDDTLQPGDKLLGTDITGNQTKNYPLKDLKEYIESGIDLTLKVPHGYVGTVNLTEDDYAVTGIREDLTNLTTEIGFYVQNSPGGEHDNLNAGMFRLVADGSGWYFEVEEYTGRYYLPSFVGTKVEGLFGTPAINVSFSVDSIHTFDDGKEYYNNPENENIVGGGRVWRFNITRDNPEEWVFEHTENQYTSFTVNVDPVKDLNRSLQLATVYFQSDVDMQNVHIDTLDADLIVFDGINDSEIPSEGIRFGALNNTIYSQLALSGYDVRFQSFNNSPTQGRFFIEADTILSENLTVDANAAEDNSVDINTPLTVAGQTDLEDVVYIHDDVSVLNQKQLDFKIAKDRQIGVSNFENTIIDKNGISKRDFTNKEFKIEYVIGNDTVSRQDGNNNTVTPVNNGVLHTLQIGDSVYQMPTATSQVAQLLPGLTETLTPTAAAVTTKTNGFFYGEDNGNTATFKSQIGSPNQPGQLNIASGATTVDVNNSENATRLTQLFTNTPLGQRLFFIPSDNPFNLGNAEDGDTVTGDTYEVVSFITTPTPAKLTFTLMGQGNLIISSNTLTMQNIPAKTDEETILVIDSDNEVGRKEFANIAGIAATANYEDTKDPNSFGTLKKLTFEAGPDDHAIIVDSGGGITVDVSGGIPFDTSPKTSSFNATAWSTYILEEAATSQTVTLPAVDDLKSGATIRLVNLSDVNSNGQQRDPDSIWKVAPQSTDRIMRQPAGIEIDLNDANTNDFIWSGIPSIGWIIK